MDQALHMQIVPASHLAALPTFYVDELGWSTWGPEMPGRVMLCAGTAVIVFLDRDYPAAESGLDKMGEQKTINAVFVADRMDVDTQIGGALAAGAVLTSPIWDRDGGLYSGYFTDPEDKRLGDHVEPGDATRRRWRH